ncbi:MAG: class I SAM-dependent methyltransferase [Candidatus Wukongarchaeota archaeon]|jgi:ubiquinone/menaquinone biosynthesis C-methylase UbiE|nr:class I SAM-dependent methyltransferase [Candidatus Wukongarchaeota archaeon]MDO8128245.1 class I SAM-dependent methyltransferase [Candidatus Wukongarchaeota archaeon]
MYYKGEKMEKHHKKGHKQDPEREKIQEKMEETVLLFGEFMPDMIVLDVGTGYGYACRLLAGLFNEPGHVYSIDPSSEVIEDAKNQLETRGLGGRVVFKEGFVEKLPFKDDFFDAAISALTLHHVENLDVAVEEIARVLSPGGKLIIVEWKAKASTFVRHAPHHFLDPPEKLVEVLEKNELEILEIKEFELWYAINSIKK